MNPIRKKMARECTAVRLRLLNRVVTNLYDETLRPLGLKVSQLNILVVTANLALARPAEVCRILHLEASTLSRNLERMRASGWVETVAGEDARSQPFRLTPAGKRILEQAASAWEQGQRSANDLLGKSFLASLDQITRKLGLGAGEV